MKPFIIACICLLSFSVTSCKKEYQAKVSFWFNQSKSNALITLNNVTLLTIFIEEKQAGTMNPEDWKIGPDCDGANYTLTQTLSSEVPETFDYSIRDQNGAERFAGSFTLSKDACINIEL